MKKMKKIFMLIALGLSFNAYAEDDYYTDAGTPAAYWSSIAPGLGVFGEKKLHSIDFKSTDNTKIRNLIAELPVRQAREVRENIVNKISKLLSLLKDHEDTLERDGKIETDAFNTVEFMKDISHKILQNAIEIYPKSGWFKIVRLPNGHFQPMTPAGTDDFWNAGKGALALSPDLFPDQQEQKRLFELLPEREIVEKANKNKTLTNDSGIKNEIKDDKSALSFLGELLQLVDKRIAGTLTKVVAKPKDF
jgi:hypothetical protein